MLKVLEGGGTLAGGWKFQGDTMYMLFIHLHFLSWAEFPSVICTAISYNIELKLHLVSSHAVFNFVVY